MSTTIETTVYQFAELSDIAKERARDWWRECESQEFGSFDDIPDDWTCTAAKMLGIEFDTRPVKLMGGGTRYEPVVAWGLHTQDAGASFAGYYRYNAGALKAIRNEFPEDKYLHRIARELQALQRKYFYKLACRINKSGRDVASYSMHIEMDEHEASADVLQELLREFADYIYKRINDEWDWHMSDKNVDEAIEANEYTFTEDGARF